jgi:hypothetical protein
MNVSIENISAYFLKCKTSMKSAEKKAKIDSLCRIWLINLQIDVPPGI